MNFFVAILWVRFVTASEVQFLLVIVPDGTRQFRCRCKVGDIYRLTNSHQDSLANQTQPQRRSIALANYPRWGWVWFARLPPGFLWCAASYSCQRQFFFISDIASLIPLPLDASHYWTPESSNYEGVQKATTVHLPALSTRSCIPWSQPPVFCMCSHATSVRSSG